MFWSVENARTKQLAWLSVILDQKGWRKAQLAKRAGINHSTLTKFLTDPLDKAELSARSVELIARAASVPPYATSIDGPSRGLAEEEAAIFTAGGDRPIDAAVAAFTAGRNGVDPWIMQSDALELAGILAGDVLIVDPQAQPVDGDIVCAELYGRSGRAETAFRIFEGPYLVAASTDPDLRRPVIVDGDHARITGVVIATIRPRAAN